MSNNIWDMIWDELATAKHCVLNSSRTKCYISNPHSWKVSNIVNIKQNGPATIIFLKDGEKVVVKCQDGAFHSEIGLNTCLIKYLVPNSRIYSQCIREIFYNNPFPRVQLNATRIILAGLMDDRDFMSIKKKIREGELNEH